MRTACIYDVHGNIGALEAVLADVAGADVSRIALGGDYALNGPSPAECVDRLRSLGSDVAFLQGNTDRWIAQGRGDEGVHWTAAALGPERVAWLGALSTRIELLEHDALLVHATPRSDEEKLFPDTDEGEAAAMLEGVERSLVVCGHVHVQYLRRVAGRTVLNPGSVGFPSDGQTTAAWALLTDDGAELRRSAYDVEDTIARLAASTSPVRERSIARLRGGDA